ncbi:hypothetical protein LOK49_LG07G01780 [Camellia lanceoleosa]|uniref:Uncharacterized protein n=1 Tax=Camellia lanceoleosa TaxID=1840588 RepID=A0ACC0H805_9ERIC|nr:hypothetical protein LOK49_LG07G01780 [Camellia lanceoleosa]
MTSSFAGILTKIKEDHKKNSEKKIKILEKAYVQEEQRLRHEEQRLFQKEQRLFHEKERLAMKNEIFRAEQLKEEKRIMLMNSSGLSPMQQQYYDCRRLEILEKGK